MHETSRKAFCVWIVLVIVSSVLAWVFAYRMGLHAGQQEPVKIEHTWCHGYARFFDVGQGRTISWTDLTYCPQNKFPGYIDGTQGEHG